MSESFVVEEGRRLSQSVLWQLQREHYDARGIQAWSHGNVPQTITTTPYIARAYARVVLGYLRDMASVLDPTQPVYIVELGAGSGRFGYRFITRFRDILQRASVPQKSFKYVMTDVAPSLIEYWQSHPKLRPLVEAGVLDFAEFDASQPAGLALTTTNPIVVLANYCFDSIPHDSFSVHEGQLSENLVRLTSRSPTPVLGELEVSFDAKPVSSEYYPEPQLNRVLEGYRQRLNDVMLLFPVAAMRCIEYFRQLSHDRMLLIAGDIGVAREGDMDETASGGVGNDNNFWLEVNFHALGEFVRELGGQVLHPPYRHASLNISTFILGQPPAGTFNETALAYDEQIAQRGPDDFFLTNRVISSRYEGMHRGELLAFLRSTGWDSDYFLQAMPFLMDSLAEISWSGREDMRLAVEEAWREYYPMGHGADPGDLVFGFGVLLYSIGDYAPALEFFQRSLELFGTDPRTTFNIALCLFRMERLSEALEWVERTLELDPQAEQAREMRATLTDALAGRSPSQ